MFFEEVTRKINEALEAFSNSVYDLLEKHRETLANLAELALHIKESEEKREFLLNHDWLFCCIPDEIITHFLCSKELIIAQDVDDCIIKFFEEDGAAELKNMLKTWEDNECFYSRKHIFEEALFVHMFGYFNSSTALLTLHTEGVIKDFSRIMLQNPRWLTKESLSDVDTQLGALSIDQFDSFLEVSSCLHNWDELKNFIQGNFDHKYPEQSSDFSRNKTAHGLVVAKMGKIDSLKRFLYLNEIYRIFYVIRSNDNVVG